MATKFFGFKNINKSSKTALRLACALFLLLSIGFIGTPTANAEVSDQDGVQKECYKVISKGARDACDNSDKTGNLITKTRNVASYHCKEKQTETVSSGGEKVDDKAQCIQRYAIGLIRDAATAAPKPTSVNGFTQRLTRILQKDADKSGGSLDEPSDDSKQSLSAECTSGTNPTCLMGISDPAACAAYPNLEGCGADPNQICSGQGGCDLVSKYVNPTIQMMTILFGLIAVISIVAGGMQYTASTGDPQKVTAAKRRIGMTLMAIAAYAFLYGFVEFLIPGGIFN